MLGAGGHGFVLVVGDDATLLVRARGGRIRERRLAATGSPEEADAVVATIRRRPRLPLTLLVDTRDQTCRRENLPPVGPLDRRRLVARRLAREGAGLRLRRALLAPRRAGDARLLIAGAAPSPALDDWLGRIDRLPNPVLGIGLLPLEADAIRRRLSGASTEAADGAVMLIERRHVSGHRISVYGRWGLLLTRTVAPSGDTDIAVGAAALAAEIDRTRDYFRRSADSEFLSTLILIDGAAFSEDVSESVEPFPHLVRTTPREAARHAGIYLPPTADATDELHAVAAVRGVRFPVQRTDGGGAPAIPAAAPRTAFRVAAALAAAAVLWLGAAWTGLDRQHDEVARLAASERRAQAVLATVESRAADLPEEPERMRQLIDAWHDTAGGRTALAPAWGRIAAALDPDTVATAVEWVVGTDGGGTVRLTLRPGDHARGVDAAEALADGLRRALPGHLVERFETARDVDDTGSIAGEAGIGMVTKSVPEIGLSITLPAAAAS